MFDLTPLSRPVAVIEMLLLLTFAAVVGWIMARLILNNRINTLRAAIVSQETELDNCRQSKRTVSGSAPKSANLPFAGTPDSLPVPATAPINVGSDVGEPDLAESESLLSVAPLALAPERPIIDPLPPVPDVFTPAIVTTSGGSEAAVLQRIAARAGELNFDRIGLATAAEADDLKDIIGIGPFLERKLHSLGIYTFRQIANFDREDVDRVNEIIEFFPGRILRDNWVEQANEFYQRKYGKSAK